MNLGCKGCHYAKQTGNDKYLNCIAINSYVINPLYKDNCPIRIKLKEMEK